VFESSTRQIFNGVVPVILLLLMFMAIPYYISFDLNSAMSRIPRRKIVKGLFGIYCGFMFYVDDEGPFLDMEERYIVYRAQIPSIVDCLSSRAGEGAF
jgi:hypothetical protein